MTSEYFKLTLAAPNLAHVVKRPCKPNHIYFREVQRAMKERKPSQILCLDIAFDIAINDDDVPKTSTVLEAKSHGIVFKTV